MGSESYRILVAEDDEAFLDVVEELLAADGCFDVVGRARDGREAIALAADLDLDAVVMDIEMPVVDGIEATRELARTSPGLPIIAISGHDYEERVLEIRAAGAADYVRKARIEDELVSTLLGLIRPRARRAADGSEREPEAGLEPTAYRLQGGCSTS